MKATDKNTFIRFYIFLLMLFLAIDMPKVTFTGIAFCVFFYRDFFDFLREQKILLMLMGLFLLTGMLSAWMSPYPASWGLIMTCHYGIFIGTSFLIFFLISISGKNADLFFLQVLVGLAVLLALIAFAEVTNESVSRFLADHYRYGERLMINGRVRTGATLNHSNIFGCFMSLAMLILIHLKEKIKLKAPVFYPVMAILVIAMTLSGSRNAVLVLMVPLLLLLLNKKTAKMIALMIGTAIVTLAILTASTTRFSDLWKVISPAENKIFSVEKEAGQRFNTASTRLWLWQGAWAMFWDHPLTGVGPGCSNLAMKDYASAPLLAVEKEKIEKMCLNAHNGFLNILAEFGLAGSAAALAIALYLAFFLFRHQGVFPPRPVHAVSAGIILSFIPDAFFYSKFYMTVALTLFLIFAFPSSASPTHTSSPTSDQPASGQKG